jgi:hypothetical protein
MPTSWIASIEHDQIEVPILRGPSKESNQAFHRACAHSQSTRISARKVSHEGVEVDQLQVLTGDEIVLVDAAQIGSAPAERPVCDIRDDVAEERLIEKAERESAVSRARRLKTLSLSRCAIERIWDHRAICADGIEILAVCAPGVRVGARRHVPRAAFGRARPDPRR